MSEVDSKSDLPKSNYHIYHATSPRNLHDILVSGIKKSPSVGKWRRVNKYLSIVREEDGLIQSCHLLCVYGFGSIIE